MIEAKIIADSYNPLRSRLTTFLLRYPRFIHADFMTHRVFSRNASSSRARPITKVIEEAEFEPALPIFWGKNQKGMQSATELEGPALVEAKWKWDHARLEAVRVAKCLNGIGLHKQYVNRLLEPFTHITVICTSTEYNNFFNLRAHPDAMPEIQELAYQMLTCYHYSTPKQLKAGEWHLPFCDQYVTTHRVEDLLKVCTARCARVSYLNFEGNIDNNKDYELHDSLKDNGHWSPFEHAAQALDTNEVCGNLIGYKQYRKFFSNENQVELDAPTRLKNRKKDVKKSN